MGWIMSAMAEVRFGLDSIVRSGGLRRFSGGLREVSGVRGLSFHGFACWFRDLSGTFLELSGTFPGPVGIFRELAAAFFFFPGGRKSNKIHAFFAPRTFVHFP